MPEFRVVPAGEPPATDLIAAMVVEMSALYEGPIDAAGLPTATTTDLGPPGGAYVVGFVDGEPMCGGGVKRLGDGVGEIKRMYVVPRARRRGVGRALLGALEDTARDLGYERVRLDTGARQPQARRLYETAGYVAVADYNDNPYAAFWGEKALS